MTHQCRANQQINPYDQNNIASHRPNRLVPRKDRESSTRFEHLSEGRVGVLAETVQVGGHELGVELDELVLKRQGSLGSETVEGSSV